MPAARLSPKPLGYTKAAHSLRAHADPRKTEVLLREVGKRDLPVLKKFLKTHCRTMPRTMLRYAIERFPERKRVKYLRGEA